MASKITKIVANFETQLSTTINVGSTNGVLKYPVLDDDGVQLADGKYVMCVDIGNSKVEHLIFDLVGLTGAMSNIFSISKNGTETSGAVRQHRSGAKVSLTDYANLLYISKILMGQVGLDGANPLFYDSTPVFTTALQLATKGYVDTKASQDYPNVFTAKNTFTLPPSVPSPVDSNDAVNLAYVLSLAFSGVAVGFNKMSVSYDFQGRIKSIRDNELGVTYSITYDTQDNPIKIFNGTTTWRINYSGDRVVSITK